MTMSPALKSCASAGAAPTAKASASANIEANIEECVMGPSFPVVSCWPSTCAGLRRSTERSRFDGELESSLCMVGVDRHSMPFDLVHTRGKRFGDRHDQNGLVAGFGSRRSERRHAIRAGQTDLGKFGLDALAEFEPDFARRCDRSADGRRRLLELGVGEGCARGQSEGERGGDSQRDNTHGLDSFRSDAWRYAKPMGEDRSAERVGEDVVEIEINLADHAD